MTAPSSGKWLVAENDTVQWAAQVDCPSEHAWLRRSTATDFSSSAFVPALNTFVRANAIRHPSKVPLKKPNAQGAPGPMASRWLNRIVGCEKLLHRLAHQHDDGEDPQYRAKWHESELVPAMTRQNRYRFRLARKRPAAKPIRQTSIPALRTGVGYGERSQVLRCKIRPVRPSECMSHNRERLEVIDVSERFKNGTIKRLGRSTSTHVPSLNDKYTRYPPRCRAVFTCRIIDLLQGINRV